MSDPVNSEAQAVRQAADDLRSDVYNPAQTDFQRTYNQAMSDAADFLVSRAIDMETIK